MAYHDEEQVLNDSLYFHIPLSLKNTLDSLKSVSYSLNIFYFI